MRRLLLLRHAKSAWNEPGLKDFDRPLNARGRQAAPLMARHMAARTLVPSFALISPARRTRETWDALTGGWGATPAHHFEPTIYDAEPDTLLELVRALPDDAASALVIGHNPGLQILALELARGSTAPAYAAIQRKFPTTALAVIDFDTDHWSAVRPGAGALAAFTTPRDLDGSDDD